MSNGWLPSQPEKIGHALWEEASCPAPSVEAATPRPEVTPCKRPQCPVRETRGGSVSGFLGGSSDSGKGHLCPFLGYHVDLGEFRTVCQTV